MEVEDKNSRKKFLVSVRFRGCTRTLKKTKYPLDFEGKIRYNMCRIYAEGEGDWHSAKIR